MTRPSSNWWSRWESSPRPLECDSKPSRAMTRQYPKSARDFKVLFTARSMVVSTRLHEFRDKTRTVQRVFTRRNYGRALLIAHLMLCSNPMLHKVFSTAVRELSVSFGGIRTWKLSFSVCAGLPAVTPVMVGARSSGSGAPTPAMASWVGASARSVWGISTRQSGRKADGQDVRSDIEPFLTLRASLFVSCRPSNPVHGHIPSGPCYIAPALVFLRGHQRRTHIPFHRPNALCPCIQRGRLPTEPGRSISWLIPLPHYFRPSTATQPRLSIALLIHAPVFFWRCPSP